MMKSLRSPFLAAAAACALFPLSAAAQTTPPHETSGDALARLLAATPAGHWIEVQNTHMADVVYKGPLEPSIHGSWGPPAIMGAWSGATLDTNNERLIVWGGGHNDYYGNEVYAFNLKTLTWVALNAPSNPAGYTTQGNGPAMADGAPPVLHTYDMMAFVPETNDVLVPAGASSYSNGNQTGAKTYPYTWAFNLATRKWRDLAHNELAGGAVDIVFHYNSADHMLYGMSQEKPLERYNPATNAWNQMGLGARLTGYHMTGAIDPVDDLLVAVGSDGHEGFLNVVNLRSGISSVPRYSGDLKVQNGNSPGFVWDSAASLLVGWNGGDTLFTLDPKTWHWTAVEPAANNAVVPSRPAQNGTFGRFQYDAAHDVFLLVNDINQDVFLFKPDFGSH